VVTTGPSPQAAGDPTPVVAAVDVGGTRVKAALVDRELAAVVSLTLATPAALGEPGRLVEAMALVVEQLATRAGQEGAGVDVVGCGVVVPGLVDEERGVAVLSANLGWRDLDVAEPLARRLGLRTVLGHDVRAGLLAERAVGAAAGADHALFVPVGTGIAGALMLEGHVLHVDGWAGELGHVVVEPGGPVCGCGARGCLEAVASAAAVERDYAALAGVHLSAEGVASRVEAGEPAAAAVWGRAVEALARAVAMTVTLTGVDLVLVGGGLAQSGRTLLDPLTCQVDSALTFQRRPRIVRAALGDRAGCLGAACLGWGVVR
jgi:glucokinase